MNTKVPPRAQTQSQNGRAQLFIISKVPLSALLHKLELLESLVHLDDGARAVDELVAWVDLLDV
jgi:hypothetical protein